MFVHVMSLISSLYLHGVQSQGYSAFSLISLVIVNIAIKDDSTKEAKYVVRITRT